MNPGTLTPLADRFWSKVEIQDADECWIWLGARNGLGYGHISRSGSDGVCLMAHRVAYELLVGPIDRGLELDHLCRNPGCVNPSHLEPVTHRENTLRGGGFAAENARKTHCKRGHAFTPENTYTWKGRAGRGCRECRRLRDAARDRRVIREFGP